MICLCSKHNSWRNQQRPSNLLSLRKHTRQAHKSATIRVIRDLRSRLAGTRVSSEEQQPQKATEAASADSNMDGKQKAVLVTSFDESKVNSSWANLEVGERSMPDLKNGEVSCQ